MQWLVCITLCMGAVLCNGCREARGAPTESGGRTPEEMRAETALSGMGTDGVFALRLQLSPATPKVGELFEVETLVTDAVGGTHVSGAQVRVDGAMPGHGHGMLTTPVHSELGGGRYLTEGMKFHMPGRWTLQAQVNSPDGRSDRLTLDYLQIPDAER